MGAMAPICPLKCPQGWALLMIPDPKWRGELGTLLPLSGLLGSSSLVRPKNYSCFRANNVCCSVRKRKQKGGLT